MKRGQMALCGAVTLALLAGIGSAVFGAGTARAASDAFVRVAHAAPAAPNVDVYVDGGSKALLSSFAFGTVTDYVPLAAGSHKIQVVPAGQTLDKAVITQSVDVQAGKYYTVAAIGDTNTTPALVAFADDNSVAANKAKVRVYHLSSDAGAVSVGTGGSTLIDKLEFKNASDYLSVASGSYTFDVTLLDKSNQKQTLNASLTANKVTSVFALGLVGGTGDTSFKFVPKVADGMPTQMPDTGFAPMASQTTETPASVYLFGAIVALALIGGAGLAILRRRIR